MKNISKLATLFFLVVLFGYSTAHSASSYFVDNSVGSSGNGSQGSAWKELSNINWTTISNASKPCTIYVSGGASGQSYTLSSALAIGASGSGVGSEVILKKASESDWSGHGGTVYVVCSSGGVAFSITARSYVIIDGFDVTGGFWISSSGANADYITIRNNWIHNWTSADYGAGLTMGTTRAKCNYLTIQNNRIGPPANSANDDPIVVGGSTNCTIEGNIIEYSYSMTSGSHADGIHVQGASHDLRIRYNWIRGGFLNAAIYLEENDATNETDGIIIADIYGNIIENCYNPGSNTWQGIFIAEVNSNATYNYEILNIYNNVFANLNLSTDEAGLSFRIGPASSSNNQWRVENNVFYNAVVSLDSGVYTSNLVWNNNWYYNNDGIRNGLLISWKGTEYRNLSSFYSATGFEASYNTPIPHLADPKFTDLDHSYRLTHDFRPASDSALIDHGKTLSSPFDVGISTITAYSNWPYYAGSGALGNGISTISRPQGSGWDIGPYEYGDDSGGVPNPPKNLRIVP